MKVRYELQVEVGKDEWYNIIPATPFDSAEEALHHGMTFPHKGNGKPLPMRVVKITEEVVEYEKP